MRQSLPSCTIRSPGACRKWGRKWRSWMFSFSSPPSLDLERGLSEETKERPSKNERCNVDGGLKRSRGSEWCVWLRSCINCYSIRSVARGKTILFFPPIWKCLHDSTWSYASAFKCFIKKNQKTKHTMLFLCSLKPLYETHLKTYSYSHCAL